MTDRLAQLFQRTFGSPPDEIAPLRADGSDREIYRLRGGGYSAVGVRNEHLDENDAFVGFTESFRRIGLAVPEIFAYDRENGVYLEADLGDTTLADYLAEPGRGPVESIDLITGAVRALARFQIEGDRAVDYSLCYQGGHFDRAAALRDLEYFREAFLGLVYGGDRDDRLLTEEFELLASAAFETGEEYFLYRDFQPRNMMAHEGELFYIDYQSGRKGPLAYDVASMLYSSTLAGAPEIHDQLIDAHVESVTALGVSNGDSVRQAVPIHGLLRSLQALGTAGNVGVRKGKARFLKPVPVRSRTIRRLLAESGNESGYRELVRIFDLITESPEKVLKIGNHG